MAVDVVLGASELVMLMVAVLVVAVAVAHAAGAVAVGTASLSVNAKGPTAKHLAVDALGSDQHCCVGLVEMMVKMKMMLHPPPALQLRVASRPLHQCANKRKSPSKTAACQPSSGCRCSRHVLVQK